MQRDDFGSNIGTSADVVIINTLVLRVLHRISLYSSRVCTATLQEYEPMQSFRSFVVWLWICLSSYVFMFNAHWCVVSGDAQFPRQ